MNLKKMLGPGLMTILGLHAQVSAQAPATTPAEFTAGQSAEGKTV